MIKISIIIPVYNVYNYIECCLNSVLNQDYPSIECIMVNDCTPDNSIELIENKLRNYSGNITFTMLHHEKNRGVSAARNSGIKAATGDYIYFLDGDDTITPNCISLLANLAKEYTGVDIVQGNIALENSAANTWLDISKNHLPPYSSDYRWLKEKLLFDLLFSVWNKLIRKEVIVSNQLYFREDLTMAEDMLWCFILSKYVASIAFCEAPSYCYRYNPESLTHSDSTNEKRLIAYKILGQSMLDNTDPDFKYISCLCIVKVFYEIKKLGLEQDKELFFELMKKAMKSKNVPLSFMAMFIFLLLPKRIVKKMPFLWQKGLGILYRYGKCKDRNCRERK